METSVLDMRVGVALMRLRLLERAIHDRGVWEMEYAGVKTPVSRFVREDRVSLVAHFPAMCPLTQSGQPQVGLYIDGELVRAFPLSAPLDEEGAEVWCDLVLETPVLA